MSPQEPRQRPPAASPSASASSATEGPDPASSGSVATKSRMTTKSQKTKKPTSAGDVLLYVPNLLGYGRVLASIVSIYLMSTSSCVEGGGGDDSRRWVLAVCLYVASFAGDLFDGMAARALNQCSEYGQLLDMITDRCSTAGLLHVLSFEYGGIRDNNCGMMRMLFLGLILLDVSSHWCQMYSSLRLDAGSHHKSAAANADRFFLVRWYYGYYYFFGYCCVGAECTYILLYIMAQLGDDDLEGSNAMLSSVFTYALMACIPACAVKQLVNVAQLSSACVAVARNDADAKNR